MDNETPKPMKKVHRGLLHKVGKQLEKFEQNLVTSSPSFSTRSQSISSNDTFTSYQHSNSENSQKQDDNISLQHFSPTHSDSPKAILRDKHGILYFLKII